MFVGNLKTISLIVQQQVYVAIFAKGGVLNIDITSQILINSNWSPFYQLDQEKVSAEELRIKERKRTAKQIKTLEMFKVERKHQKSNNNDDITEFTKSRK